MKKLALIASIAILVLACKTETNEVKTETAIETKEELPKEIKKTAKQIKEELTAKGFDVFYDIDTKTQDTFLMQKYFMAFLKRGPIRNQNEEEANKLQTEHIAHLVKMYELGYADISGPFGDDGDIRGITIYNVPTREMADSLAHSDPMVKAGRLIIEMHPWYAAKGFPLR